MQRNALLRTATTVSPHSAADGVLVSPSRPRLRDLATTSARPSREPSELLRRAANLIMAAVLLILALPLMICIAVAVRLTSAGPAIYSQPRVGLDRRAYGAPSGNHRRSVDYGGKLFLIYKFRTMQVDSREGPELWAQPGDPRVTRIGGFLRRYRLDELPQLYNVLRGDMNIVGPRPEQPAIFASLREQIGGYAQRQRVLPGITGWAQINQHYDRCIEDVRRKVRLDLRYIARRSVAEDLRIMALTIPVVVFKRGAW